MTEERWTEIQLDDWEQFIKIVRPPGVYPTKCVYRGQSNSAWTLKPKLARLSEDDFQVAYNMEKRIWKIFRGRSMSLVEPNLHQLLVKYALPNWWAVMQHHGAPTRILDWSYSPFVAAYFACEVKGHPGSIWQLNTKNLDCLNKDSKKFEKFLLGGKATIYKKKKVKKILYTEDMHRKRVIAAGTNFLTDRMERQQSRFTWGNQPHIDHVDAMSKEVLQKLIIPECLKSKFMTELQAMNITGYSLFPGIDGVGRYCTDISTHNLSAI